MIEIYIAENNFNRGLGILDVINKVTNREFSFTCDYSVTLARLNNTSLKEILGRTRSGNLDLMVFPLFFSEEGRMTVNSQEDYVAELDGVKLGLRYREEGYRGPILLTLDEYFPFSFEQSVERACGYNWSLERNDKCLLNLYSTEMPVESRTQILSHLLRDEPKVEFSVIDHNPRGN